MDHAAQDVMTEYKDIVLAFGESDEFSFVFQKSTSLYNRRHTKIVTTVTSLFTSCYVFHWQSYFPDSPLRYPPSFDGRIVLYPTEREVRDYLSWRQADTHINNLYNTAFWALVQQGGETTTQAHATLRGTNSSTKHELLFSRFQINYNEISARFRKGSVIVREEISPETNLAREPVHDPAELEPSNSDEATIEHSQGIPSRNTTKKDKQKDKFRTRIDLFHGDIIGDEFWQTRPRILSV
ncbi:hypothetical protein PILCRDRAFT_817887 [Piloderma croceum F 1598]|uniref:tRNA(His) guanylyltransferase n=1 Tax=Piloderma croceum (strain F 1598) TaxID=765440 RepID=A0A0C3FLU2_PILCF|nr:hypothetical protein PILCRDRAFT_817887 [Piloderma croceum F 1598]